MFSSYFFLTLCIFYIGAKAVQRENIPVVDITALLQNNSETCKVTENNCASELNRLQVVSDIINACRSTGFFYITNHGVSNELIEDLVSLSKEFFELPQEFKDLTSMSLGGKAWRGYFRLGDEVTSSIPDQKEGYYYGTELEASPLLPPLHGPNFWPNGPIGERMKYLVLRYMSDMKIIGLVLMKAILEGLGINSESKLNHLFSNPTELFRIFNYPAHNSSRFPENSMGVGEHTDYGYITILWQETVDVAGLQVKSLDGKYWIDAPPIPGTFVINIGDALEHATGGLLRATPHRVLQRVNASSDRLSFPYFFDPSFNATLTSLVPLMTSSLQDALEVVNERRKTGEIVASRWDKQDPTVFQGTYGDYLLSKVSKAFPDLAEDFINVKG